MLDVRAQKQNPKAPDFQCPDANCLNDKGYRTGAWLPKPKGGYTPNPGHAPRQEPPSTFVPPAAPQAQPAPSGGVDVTADGMRVALFWDSFDSVLDNIAKRKLTDMFKPENICNLVATLYIGRTPKR